MTRCLPIVLLCFAYLPATAEERSTPITEPVVQRVINGLTGDPVHGASVQTTSYLRFYRTDEHGLTLIDNVESSTRITASKVGFEDASAPLGHPIKLWPIDSPKSTIDAHLANRYPRERDRLDDPDLTDAARQILVDQLLSEGDHHARPPNRSLKQALQPPATIRIYRRGPENNSCEGRVEEIPLEEYVKGVVPHEWIPSWHDESLRAGAIAARSYAWGWIEAGGKYDCADLDDTTRSQVYEEGRTARASLAVDSTAGVGVMRDGAIVRAEYSAENGDPTLFDVSEPLCAGEEVFGHGRGMCQWGTQRWATRENKTAEWMVAHYYPNATVSSAPLMGAPQLALGQRIRRIDSVECLDPESSFGCADFVAQGWSAGLFDLFVDHQFYLDLSVSNNGDQAAMDVNVQFEFPSAFLHVDAVDSDGTVTRGVEGSLTVGFPEVSVGDTYTIGVRLRGVRASVELGGPAELRTWVSAMEDEYRKSSWESPPDLNRSQQFNDGDLKMLTEVDVFDRSNWSWVGADREMKSGWRSSPADATEVTEDGLALTAAEAVTYFESPLLNLRISPPVDVHIEPVPDPPIRLWWRASEEGFIAQNSVVLNSGVHRIQTSPAADIHQLRLDLQPRNVVKTLRLSAATAIPDIDANMPNPPPADGGLVVRSDGGVAQPPDAPEPNGRVTSARYVGGCGQHSGASRSGFPGGLSHWVTLAFAMLIRVFKRKGLH